MLTEVYERAIYYDLNRRQRLSSGPAFSKLNWVDIPCRSKGVIGRLVFIDISTGNIYLVWKSNSGR